MSDLLKSNASKAAVMITRPEPQASVYARELGALGYKTFMEPLLSYETLDFEVPDLAVYQGLLVTSAKAVDVFVQRCGVQDLPVFCVGDQTAEQARALGFRDVFSAGGNAEDLVLLVRQQGFDAGARFLHVRGQHVSKPLHVMFGEAGFQADLLLVYRTVQSTEISPKSVQALRSGAVSAIVFFSERTASAFSECVREQGLSDSFSQIKALSISESVLECVRHLTWENTYIAQEPSRQGMNALLQRVL